jgi:hypothetical protein
MELCACKSLSKGTVQCVGEEREGAFKWSMLGIAIFIAG